MVGNNRLPKGDRTTAYCSSLPPPPGLPGSSLPPQGSGHVSPAATYQHPTTGAHKPAADDHPRPPSHAGHRSKPRPGPPEAPAASKDQKGAGSGLRILKGGESWTGVSGLGAKSRPTVHRGHVSHLSVKGRNRSKPEFEVVPDLPKLSSLPPARSRPGLWGMGSRPSPQQIHGTGLG